MVTMTHIPSYVYTVVVHEAEEGGYWGEVLELPGCVSQGETLEELNVNIKEAIEAVLQVQRREITEEAHTESFKFIDNEKGKTWTAVA